MCRSDKCASDANAQRAEKSNVALAKEILEVACERTGRSNGKDIGSRQPSDLTGQAEIFLDETQ